MRTQTKKHRKVKNGNTIFCQKEKRRITLDEHINLIQCAKSPADIDMFEVRQWIPEGKIFEICRYPDKKVKVTVDGYWIVYSREGMAAPIALIQGDGEILKNLRKEDIVHEESRDEIVRMLKLVKKIS